VLRLHGEVDDLIVEFLSTDKVKICRFTGGVCSRSSCDLILPNGCVVVCSLHGNPLGRFLPRSVKRCFVSIFSKHLRDGSL
jgi:hypothetical protein